MYLKRIELHGFKTFATRTALELRPGITAIVGPNGSGKSNIADAVRWALGETNLRQVRCRAAEELIFAGSARRASLGLAEVSLIFANEGGWLDLPFAEVRVSRRAYRSGENEYLLNGTRVRLRDIVDLLAGASIHAGGHVVISQGLVDAALALRPEERRLLVENLAGLKHYYLRRDDAESRLTATEDNLVHVDALIAELAPQVESLAAQAETLRRYRGLREELRALQQATFGAQAARLRIRAATAATHAERTARELAATRQEVATLRSEDDALQQDLTQARANLEDAREKLGNRTALAAAACRDRDVAAARVAAIQESGHTAREERALLTQRAAEARAAHAEAATALDAGREALAGAESRLSAPRQALARLTNERNVALALHRAAETATEERGRQALKLAESLALARATLEGMSAELARREAAASASAASLAEAERGVGQAQQAAQLAREALDTVRQEEVQTRQILDTARREEAARAQALQEAQRTQAALVARRDAQREWERTLEGYGAGPRALAAHPAARGVGGQLLTIAPAWQTALAALLGPLLEALVTADPAALLAARSGTAAAGQVRLVVVHLTGCSTPAMAIAGVEQPVPKKALATLLAGGILDQDEVLGWAAEVVRAPETPGLIAALGLDRVLLLRDSAAVLRCRPYLPALALGAVAAERAVAALADGTLVQGAEERVAGAMHRREELAGLEARAAEGAAQEATLQQALNAARDAAARAAATHAQARKAQGQADAAMTRARDEARFQERLLARTRQDAAAAQPAVERLRADLATHRERREEDERRLATMRQEQERGQAALFTARASLSAAEEGLSAATAARKDDEVSLARLRDHLAGATALERERRQRLDGLEADLVRRAAQADQAETQRRDLADALEDAAGREATAAADVAGLEAELPWLEMRERSARERHAALRLAGREASERLAAAEAAHERTRREVEHGARDLDVLRAQVAAELGCPLEELHDTPPPPGAASRVRVLREELSALGLVNGRAEEDYAATAERLDFLRAQAGDLRAGVASLRAIIAEANSTVRERFAATVEDLDGHFSTYFSRLFGGGSCKLLASYDERGLPTGMEMQAQPPGKRTRDLALLSGGERALVALALLFAMLKVRPVPFCLLDEVEAALDESNTGRFGAILRELSADIQFLLITHNRGTMLHADCLYGVTMGETGISTTVSLELDRATTAIGADTAGSSAGVGGG